MSGIIAVLVYLISFIPRGVLRSVTGPLIVILNTIASLFGTVNRFIVDLIDDLRTVTWREVEHWLFTKANIQGIWKYFNKVWDGVRKWARWARDEAYGLAGRALTAVTDFLWGTIESVKRWASRTFTELVGDIRELWRWITRTIADVIEKLTWVFGRVVLLLTDPKRFAQWAFGELWRMFLQYMEANAERYIGYLIQKALPYTLRYIGLIERILTRLM